jgi:hypothetical protein
MTESGSSAGWGDRGGASWGQTPSSVRNSPAQGFGATQPPPAPFEPADTGSGPVSAPVLWLGVAAALEVVGLALGLMSSGSPGLSLAGWLVGGLGAITVLAWFTLADSRRRTSSWYSSSKAAEWTRGTLAVIAVLVVAVNAYQFADWISRR